MGNDKYPKMSICPKCKAEIEYLEESYWVEWAGKFTGDINKDDGDLTTTSSRFKYHCPICHQLVCYSTLKAKRIMKATW